MIGINLKIKKRIWAGYYFGLIILLSFVKITAQKNVSIINELRSAEDYYLRATELRENARYDSAIVSYQLAADSLKKITEFELYIDCYNQIGRCLQYQKKYQESLHYLSKALNLGNSLLHSNHPQIALSHNFLGISYRRLYDYSKSLNHYKHALKIRRTYYGDDHILVSNVLGNIGHLHRAWNDHNKSLSYYKRSINNAVKKNDLKLAKIYLNIGVAYLFKSEYLKAENYFHKIISLLSSDKPSHSIVIQKAYFNIGLMFDRQFDNVTALFYYQNALRMFEKDSEEMILVLNNLITIYAKLGRFDEALKSCMEAIKLQDKVNPINYLSYKRLYRNLGFIHQQKEEWELSLSAFNKALSYVQLMNNQEIEPVLDLYRQLSNVYVELQRYQKALEYSEKSLNIGLKIFGEKAKGLAIVYIYYGNIYLAQKDYNTAIKYYHKALCAISRTCNEVDVFETPIIKESLEGYELLVVLKTKMKAWLGIVKSGLQDELNTNVRYLKAINTHYYVVNQLIHKIRTGFKSEGSKYLLAKEVLEILDISQESGQILYELTGDKTYLVQIFEMGELGKSMALADALAESRARTFGQLPDSLLERESALKIDLVALENRIEKLQSNEALRDSSLIDSLNGRYGKLQITYNEMLESFEENYPEYYNLKYSNTSPELADVQASLADDEAMLEYFLGEKDVRLFLITQNNFEIHKFPNDATFQELLSSFNRSIRKVSEAGSFAERSAALYDKLIRPIAEKISETKKLIIIPDGELYYLPFEALVKEMPANTQDFASMAYLVKDVEVSYHYSANLYLHSLEKEVAETKYNVAGFAPVFQDGDDGAEILESGFPVLGHIVDYLKDITRDGQQFNELPHSENEAREIVNLFDWETQKSYGYFRGEATEERFKEDAHQFKYLHLATHSFVNEDRPQLSGIAFSQPEDTSAVEDGILYSGEIYNLDLNADLVVLSSCESGLGKLIRGEGLMAMTRGFLYAGATNVLVSLWAVYDRHTSDLMTEFYRQIDDPKSYAPALRAAKLKMIENPDTAFPALWSSFVLIGR